MRGHDAYRGIQASSGSQNDAAVVRLLVPVRMNACRSSITSHANGIDLCSGRRLFVRVLHCRDFSRASLRRVSVVSSCYVRWLPARGSWAGVAPFLHEEEPHCRRPAL